MAIPLIDLRLIVPPTMHTNVRHRLLAHEGLDVVTPDTEDAVVRELSRGQSVLVTFTWRDDYLQPGLRWIAGVGAGFEQYPLEKLRAQDVNLTGAAGLQASCVAEHAFALLLSLTRRVAQGVRGMATQTWQPLLGHELGGKNLLVLGLGRIGEQVARLGAAFGMKVRGVKRNVYTHNGVAELVYPPDRLVEGLDWADVLIITAPSSEETRGIIGAAAFRQMRDGWIVNVGRGDLITGDALESGELVPGLLGLGLDVFPTEPPEAGSILWSQPNVAMTPHMGASSPELVERWLKQFIHNAKVFAGSGDVWLNRIV